MVHMDHLLMRLHPFMLLRLLSQRRPETPAATQKANNRLASHETHTQKRWIIWYDLLRDGPVRAHVLRSVCLDAEWH